MAQSLHPPRGINVFNAIAKPLLAAGIPMGFNGLLTVPGRKTGQPRATPVADGHRPSLAGEGIDFGFRLSIMSKCRPRRGHFVG